jgi:hypothetical protein
MLATYSLVQSNQISNIKSSYFCALFTESNIKSSILKQLFGTMASMKLEEQLKEQVYIKDKYLYVNLMIKLHSQPPEKKLRIVHCQEAQINASNPNESELPKSVEGVGDKSL